MIVSHQYYTTPAEKCCFLCKTVRKLETCCASVQQLISIITEYLQHKGACHDSQTNPKNQKFLENLKLAVNSLSCCNDSLFASMTLHKEPGSVFWCHCNDEIAVCSCPLLYLPWQVVKLASGLFYCWSLLHNNKQRNKFSNIRFKL